MTTTSSTFTCVVLFSDIAGSSSLFKSLGDDAAKAKIDYWIAEMLNVVYLQDGKLVKTIGDEIMVYFDDIDSAWTAAMALNVTALENGFRLKTGLSQGPIIRDNNDLFGDTVNNAAFLTSSARPEEILVDSPSAQHLGKWLKMHCDHYDDLPLKGQSDSVAILRLNWRSINGLPLEQTLVSHEPVISPDTNQELTLHFGNQSYVLNSASPDFRIGRSQDRNDLSVPSEKASRHHCTIHYRRGKFSLEDHSTNGTYVQAAGREEIYLRKESTPLATAGSFALGQPLELCSKQVHFQISVTKQQVANA